ncbi:unnamed protein product [Didymodactylos carnosus]|uniref:D-Ala-D-Ala dipeptidase n=1 Tax=Didymodactylos carnosus TaxID=1234261 RepID=A0A815IJL6_9BILA|nr:unnamed protein product [Didymodactylos carnosus]CAF1366985.1 unnamed protein product [Didymodactylos carnosus]CAF3643328.1 unnamed protein product [Didymodactylos carnosus]CAF4249810.1 unnamed protein product [Didymodactylos carnosus]
MFHILIILSTTGILFDIVHCQLPQGFVYLNSIAPDIQVSLRYASNEDFMGRVVIGYKANVSIMTEQASVGLKYVQEMLRKDNYELVIYDSYRPQKAVDSFILWTQNLTDQVKKKSYYPRLNKQDAVKLGYIAEKSGHTRGSTVDLTIIPLGQKVHIIDVVDRTLTDGYNISFLNDGTVDMGSSFDLFDIASHTNSTLVNEQSRQMRMYLKRIMEQANFTNLPVEWWHYTLINEPFPETYFNFDIQIDNDRSVANSIFKNNSFLVYLVALVFYSYSK